MGQFMQNKQHIIIDITCRYIMNYEFIMPYTTSCCTAVVEHGLIGDKPKKN